ncbi:MAG TPA: YceI family protein [Silvibacterium sp.]|nr:YceI family protein [Silvibacterium sp.]
MKGPSSWRCLFSVVLLLALGSFLHAQSTPQNVTLHLDPSRTEIHWTLSDVLHTVHGTFRLKGGLVTFDPQTGAAQGEILVDVTSGESGSHGRDSRMHRDVLESEKYPQAIFHPAKVTGALKAGTQNITVEGTLTIHGADHPLRLDTKVQVNGRDAIATTHFSVPYVAWGMKDPSTLVLRVAKEVDVDVIAKGEIGGIP